MTYLNSFVRPLSLFCYVLLISLMACSDDEKSEDVKPEIIPSFDNVSTALEGSGGDVVTIKINNFKDSEYSLFLNDHSVSYTTDPSSGDGFSILKVSVPENAVSGSFKLVKEVKSIQGPSFTYIDKYVVFNAGSLYYALAKKGEGVVAWTPFSNEYHDITFAGTRYDAGTSHNVAQVNMAVSSVDFPDDWVVSYYNANGMVVNNASQVLLGYEFERSNVTMNDIGVYDGTPSYLKDGEYASSFSKIISLAVDSDDNIFTVEEGKFNIRKIYPDGIELFAGDEAESNYLDATGTNARFGNIRSIAIDGADNLIVADGNTVRIVNPSGVVTTLAGATTAGDAEGSIGAARFDEIRAVAVDNDGLIYVYDHGNKKIKVIDRSKETVRTLKGITLPEDEYSLSTSMQVDVKGNIFFLFDRLKTLYMCVPEKNLTVRNPSSYNSQVEIVE